MKIMKKEEINDILNSEEAQIENNKRKTPIANGIIVGGIVTFIIMCILGESELIENSIFNILTWILIVIGVSTGFYIYFTKDYANKKYKENVMPDIIEKVFENSFYNAEKFIDKELYYESGLFEVKDSSSYSGSDYIEYERDEIKIVTSKLKVTYMAGKNNVTQFLGEYFINIFEKEFEDEKMSIKFDEKTSKEDRIGKLIIINIVLIIGASIPLLLILGEFGIMGLIVSIILWGGINGYIYNGMCSTDILRKHGERYGKEFSDLFLMKGSYIIGDKILTKDLINTLIKLKNYNGFKTSISIKKNIVYIALDTGRELFNAKIPEDNKDVYVKDYYLMKEIRKVNDTIADKVLKALE